MIKFHYKTYGDSSNEPLFFLHGFMGDHSDWDSIADKLASQFYCITLDLTGHGKTESDEFQDFTIENTSQAIINLLDELKISNINLLGYSMGGRFALYLVTHFSDYFNKVIIESANPGLKTEDEIEERKQKDMMLARRIQMQPFEQFLENWYELDLFSSLDKNSQKFKDMIRKKSESNNIEQLALSLKYSGTGVMPSMWDKISSINSELLLITGRHDKKYCAIAQEMKSLNQKISHEIIDDASHNVHFEQEEIFYNTVLNFLTK